MNGARRTPPHREEDAIDRHPRDFEQLWGEHFDAVFGYARRRADEESARDAVAETFTVAWRRLDDIPRDPLPWLLGVCRRTLANQRRGDGRRRALMERLRGLAPEAMPDAAERHAETQAVREALLRMSRRDREAIALTAWDGLTPAQAAVVVGCSAGAFSNRLHRARARLARELDGLADADAAPASRRDLTESEETR